MHQSNRRMNDDTRQRGEPRDPVPAQSLASKCRHLAHRVPERSRRWRPARKFLQSFGPCNRFVGIPHDAAPAKIANPVYHLRRTRSAVHKVASMQD